MGAAPSASSGSIMPMETWVSLAERPDLFEPALSIDAGNYDTGFTQHDEIGQLCLLYTSPSPRD